MTLRLMSCFAFASMTLMMSQPANAQPEAEHFAVIADLGDAFRDAARSFRQDNMPTTEKLASAYEAFTTILGNEEITPELSEIVVTMGRSMLGMSESIRGRDARGLQRHVAAYRSAMRDFSVGIADEVGLAFRAEPEVANRLGLTRLVTELFGSLSVADDLGQQLAGLGNGEAIEDVVAVALTNTGGYWSSSAGILAGWGTAGDGIGNPWGDSCSCGATQGNLICVLDDHLFCNTCEWHSRTDD
jgi:hypothetical protein